MKAVFVAAASLAFATAPLAFPFAGFDPELFLIPQVDPPVQPAGYAFGIWGVIYLWLLTSAAFGLVRRGDESAWDRPRWPLAGSLVIGAAWLAVAQTSALWATVLIWVMLILALVALARTPATDRWLLRAPVALYAGWLTAASWVSIGLFGAGFGIWLGQIGWAIASLLGALMLAALVLLRLPAIPLYAVAVVWALVAVAVANWGAVWSVVVLALLGAAGVAALGYRNARA
ncbi:hypothetical protein [Salinarimonas ramus]|uniref:Seryl-tRNA synthetase n=1 Tax=Salinarimonas ramus TaxID=690164 RepID=A0A917Q3X9_9HYPH|nr:hypothetical protein [Salinarimonas ramus]GGK18101.1 hypothetical protein GCM10011322_01010 [Salinarimonas ramus]